MGFAYLISCLCFKFLYIFHLWWGRRDSSSVQHQLDSCDHCKRWNVQAETDALHITGGGEHSFPTRNLNSIYLNIYLKYLFNLLEYIWIFEFNIWDIQIQYLRYSLLSRGRPKWGRWEAEGGFWYFVPQVSAAKLVPYYFLIKIVLCLVLGKSK